MPESPTARLLEELALYAHRPFDDEADPRPLPEPAKLQGALADMFDALLVAPLVGRKDVLERAVPANGAPVPEVRSFAPKWRTGQEGQVARNSLASSVS